MKFDGCYHGHADATAGGGRLRGGYARPARLARRHRLPPSLTPSSCHTTISRRSRPCSPPAATEIAAVLVEPVAGNMGVVPPVAGFLPGLRALTRRYGALLVFDEVMTGWRVHPQGAQVLYGVEPDLTCLGKVVGGGLPAAAYGGRRDLMEQIAPAGPVYQAGTLSGTRSPWPPGSRHSMCSLGPGTGSEPRAGRVSAAEAITRRAAAAGVRGHRSAGGNHVHALLHPHPVRDYAEAKAHRPGGLQPPSSTPCSKDGVYLPPSAFEAAFTSAVHGEAELATVEAALAAAWQR